MSVRIVHISDVHFEESQPGVAQELESAIKRAKPNFLLLTGDLISQPWKKNVSAANVWLEELAKSCGVPEDKVLIIPGNHDYGFWGSIGISALTGRPFRSKFKHKWKKRVIAFDNEKLVFLLIDSNPAVLDLARGDVSKRQIRQLVRELGDVPAEIKKQSTKIALIHHHCLPVYNERTGDRYLLLRNSQAMIEFFADNGINLVLHGHKHRATHSMLSVGGVGVENRVIEVLGAGTAMKSKDFEDRGHNFNLISIDDSGFRSITQYFSKPAGTPFIAGDQSYGFARESLEQLYQDKRTSSRFVVKRIHWDLKMNLEGDRFNEMSYTGFRTTQEVLDPAEYEPPGYWVDTGSIPGARIDESRSSHGILLQEFPRKDPRHLDFKILFSDPPSRDKEVDFVIQSWDLNACSLSEEEFRVKHPGATNYEEFEEKEIDDAIENLSWQVSFPEDFGVNHMRFEVFSQDGISKQTKLTEMLASGFVFSRVTNSACLNLHKPPSGYRYRITWKIPQNPQNPLAQKAATRPSIPAGATFNLQKFKKHLLGLRKTDEKAPHEPGLKAQAIVASYQRLVAERVAVVNKANPEDINLETSFMVYDDSQKPGMLLPTVATLMSDPNIWQFSLERGDGNAGRAYKHNIARMWFAQSPRGGPSDSYIDGTGQRHEFLCSFPLRHPLSEHLIMGILNVGTFDKATSDACRYLDTYEGVSWLIATAHEFVLTRLMEEAKI